MEANKQTTSDPDTALSTKKQTLLFDLVRHSDGCTVKLTSSSTSFVNPALHKNFFFRGTLYPDLTACLLGILREKHSYSFQQLCDLTSDQRLKLFHTVIRADYNYAREHLADILFDTIINFEDEFDLFTPDEDVELDPSLDCNFVFTNPSQSKPDSFWALYSTLLNDIHFGIFEGTPEENYAHLFDQARSELSFEALKQFSNVTARNFITLHKVVKEKKRHQQLVEENHMRELALARQRAQIKHKIEHALKPFQRRVPTKHVWHIFEHHPHFDKYYCKHCDLTTNRNKLCRSEQPDEEWVQAAPNWQTTTGPCYTNLHAISSLNRRRHFYDPKKAPMYVKQKPHQPKFDTVDLFNRIFNRFVDKVTPNTYRPEDYGILVNEDTPVNSDEEDHIDKQPLTRTVNRTLPAQTDDDDCNCDGLDYIDMEHCVLQSAVQPQADQPADTVDDDNAADQGQVRRSEYNITSVKPATVPMTKLSDATILNTSYYLDTVVWTTSSTGALAQYNIPQELFRKIDFAGRGLYSYYMFIRSNIDFSITTSAPRQAVGFLKMFIEPRPEIDIQGSAIIYDTTVNNFVHSDLILGGNNVGSLEAPYVETTRVVRLRSDENFSKLVLYVFNPLRFAQTSSVSLTVTFKLSDPHVALRSIPVDISSTESEIETVYNTMTAEGRSESEIKDRLEPLVLDAKRKYQEALYKYNSATKLNLNKIADESETQIFGLISSAITGVASLVNTAKNIKDIVGKQDTPEQDVNNGEAAVTQGPVGVHTLGATNAEVFSDFQDVIALEPHNGDIAEICEIPSRAGRFVWNSTLESGTLLYKFPVAPWWSGFVVHEDVLPMLSAAQIQNTNLSFFSNFFNLWTGSITYTFEPIVNMFHNGSLYIAFLPGYNVSDVFSGITLDECRNLEHINLVLESKSDSKFTFKIPYINDEDAKRNIPCIDAYKKYTMPDCVLGTILIFVQNPLTVVDPTSSNVVDVNVYNHIEKGNFKFIQPSFVPEQTDSNHAPSYGLTLSNSYHIYPGSIQGGNSGIGLLKQHLGDKLAVIVGNQAINNIIEESQQQGKIYVLTGKNNSVSQIASDEYVCTTAKKDSLVLQPQPNVGNIVVKYHSDKFVITHPSDWQIVKDKYRDNYYKNVIEECTHQSLDQSTEHTPDLILDNTGSDFNTCYSDTTMNIYNLLKRPALKGYTYSSVGVSSTLFDHIIKIYDVAQPHEALMQIFYAHSGSRKYHIHCPNAFQTGGFITAYTGIKPRLSTFNEMIQQKDSVVSITGPAASIGLYNVNNKVAYSAINHPISNIVLKYYNNRPLMRCKHTMPVTQAASTSLRFPFRSDDLYLAIKRYQTDATLHVIYYSSVGEDFNLHYLTNAPITNIPYTEGDTLDFAELPQNPPIPGIYSSTQIDAQLQASIEEIIEESDHQIFTPDELRDMVTAKFRKEQEQNEEKRIKDLREATSQHKQKKANDYQDKQQTFEKTLFRSSTGATLASGAQSKFRDLFGKISTHVAKMVGRISTFKNFVTQSIADEVIRTVMKSLGITCNILEYAHELITLFRIIYLVVWLIIQLSNLLSGSLTLSGLFLNIGAIMVVGYDSPLFESLLEWIKSLSFFQINELSFVPTLVQKLFGVFFSLFKLPTYFFKDVMGGFFRGFGSSAGKSFYEVMMDALVRFFDWLKNGTPVDPEFDAMKEVMPALLDQYDEWEQAGLFCTVKLTDAKHRLELMQFLNTCRCVSHRLKTLEAERNSIFKTYPSWKRFVDHVDKLWNDVSKSSISVNRPEPIGIALAGSPGIGKSMLATNLLPAFLMPKLRLCLSRKMYKDAMYCIPNSGDQKFFDGYVGQPWTVYDDLGSTAEGADWKLMINLISSAVAPVNQADIKDKGMLFVSPFVCATTNVTAATGISGITDHGAIDRRFVFKYLVDVRKEYTKSGKLDTAKLSKKLQYATNEQEELEILDAVFKFIKFDYKDNKSPGAQWQGTPIVFSHLVGKIADEYVARINVGSELDKRLDNDITPIVQHKENSAAVEIARKANQGFNFKNISEELKKHKPFKLLEFSDSDTSETPEARSLYFDMDNMPEYPVNDKLKNFLEPLDNEELKRLSEMPTDELRKLVEDSDHQGLSSTQDDYLKHFLDHFNENSNPREFCTWARTLDLEKLVTDTSLANRNAVDYVMNYRAYEDFATFYQIFSYLDNDDQKIYLLSHFVLRAHLDKYRGVEWKERMSFHFIVPTAKPVDDFTVAASFLEVRAGPILTKAALPIGNYAESRWQGISDIVDSGKSFLGITMRTIGLLTAISAFWIVLIFIVTKIFPAKHQGYSLKDHKSVKRVINESKHQGIDSNLIKLWKRSMVNIYNKDGNFQLCGFAISNSYVLMPYHTIAESDVISITYPSLARTPEKFISFKVDDSMYVRLTYPGKEDDMCDLMLVKMPCQLPSVRKSLPQFITNAELFKLTAGFTKTITHVRSIGAIPGPDVDATLVGKYKKKSDYNLLGYVTSGFSCFHARADPLAEAGMCGTPYVYQNKILGMHVIGHLASTVTGFAPVTRETLELAIAEFENDTDFSIQILAEPVEECTHEGLTLLDNEYKFSINLPTNTDFKRGFLYNPNFEDNHAPPSLSKQILIDEEYDKYRVDRTVFYPGLKVFNYVNAEFDSAMLKDNVVSRLDEDVILNGSEDLNVAPMDEDTSAGVWRISGKGKTSILDVDYNVDTGKKTFSIKEGVVHPKFNKTFREALEETEKDYAQGHRFGNDFWQSSLKDELRKIGKKPRAFECSSFLNTYLVKKYLGDFISTYRNRPGPRLGHAIGTDRNRVWKEIYISLNTMGRGEVVDLDYSKYDGSISPVFFLLFSEAIWRFYSKCNDPEGDRIRKCIVHELQHSFHILGNEVFMSHKGNNSGSWITDAFNSFVNNYLIRSAFYFLQYEFYQDVPYEFNDHVCMYTYGDDVILATSDLVKDFFILGDLVHYIKSVGFNVTAADKTDNICYKPLNDSTFLKSGFSVKEGIVLAPLPKQIIYREINWMRKQAHQDPMIYGQRLRDALRFAVHHSKEFFLEIYNYILSVSPSTYFPAIRDLDYISEINGIHQLQAQTTTINGYFSLRPLTEDEYIFTEEMNLFDYVKLMQDPNYKED